ncbi:Lrp/AsnC family transcriptional regulator [Thermocatellispora tengchongensis]|uniref:Lrp/AsnC family transcriptional regulator n=1 Tax=Thermocatellispora tengchongensis TaxID=1073253 RepID=UPI001C859B9C|nr:Lrp/AsnC family transcriptional regulator [Thermocatellispora tengchongensis]
MDAIDRSLIELLRRDGRASVRDLAARLHISRANAYARLDRLKREGVITGFTVTVNPERYGYGLSAWVAVKLRQQSWRAFRDRLHEVPSVELATLVTGDFDILLLVRAADSRELRDMVLERLQSMPEVVNTQTTVIFDEVAPLRRP